MRMTIRNVFTRQFLVNKSFQFQIAGYFTLLYIANLLLLYIGLRWYLNSGGVELGRILSLSDDSVSYLQTYILDVLNWFFLVFGSIGALCIWGGGVIITNRAAGPIFNLLNFLKKHNQGQKMDPVSFRKKDFFHELKNEVNIALAGPGDV